MHLQVNSLNYENQLISLNNIVKAPLTGLTFVLHAPNLTLKQTVARLNLVGL